MERSYEVLLRGTWNYNDGIKKPIEIIKQNWDFYYEEGYEDDPPDLNDNGEAYYVIFGEYDDIRYADRSQTCFSIDEAIALARKKTSNHVTWSSVAK